MADSSDMTRMLQPQPRFFQRRVLPRDFQARLRQRQPRASLSTTSLNRAEILYGIAALPTGRRKDALAAAAELMFQEDLAGRILPFDGDGARHYAKLVTTRRNAGALIEAIDALIAATALAAGAQIATRDVGGFAGCGLRLVNPWDPPSRV